MQLKHNPGNSLGFGSEGQTGPPLSSPVNGDQGQGDPPPTDMREDPRNGLHWWAGDGSCNEGDSM